MASTVLRRLKGEEPGARITWLTGTTAAPLVERYVGLDAVIAVDERRLLRGSLSDRVAVLAPLWRRLARERPTDVLLLHVDWRYRALTAPLVGVRLRKLTRAGQRPSLIPGRYMGDDYARLLDGPDDRGPRVGHYALAELRDDVGDVPGEHDARGVASVPPVRPPVIIVPGGAKNVLRESALRRWPVASYAAVARALIDQGHAVMLVGDASDEWVRQEFTNLPVDDRIGALTLPQTLDMMRFAKLVISHDTGPLHLARLVGAPLIALFGPTMPSQFLIEDERTIALWGGAHLACRPCYDGRELAPCANNLCMSSLTPAAVLDAAYRLLASH